MHGCRGRSPQARSCSGAPVHAVCHRESRDAVSCPTTGLSYRAAFSPSSPLLFFLCVTGSLNKPDYCSPLLKNLQCVSVACKMKGRWLVWLTEPPQLLCPRAQLRASRSLRWATFLSAVFFTKPVLNTPSPALLGVISFPLILQRAGRCPPFSDLPGVLSCSSSTLLGTLGGSLVFV